MKQLPWGHRHTPQSWREHYKKHADEYDKRVDVLAAGEKAPKRSKHPVSYSSKSPPRHTSPISNQPDSPAEVTPGENSFALGHSRLRIRNKRKCLKHISVDPISDWIPGYPSDSGSIIESIPEHPSSSDVEDPIIKNKGKKRSSHRKQRSTMVVESSDMEYCATGKQPEGMPHSTLITLWSDFCSKTQQQAIQEDSSDWLTC